jgi:molybdopterin/thiamine biosynthesis adenylyltransferase|nr:MAG TPA: ThiF family [Bacteriophage sp.]
MTLEELISPEFSFPEIPLNGRLPGGLTWIGDYTQLVDAVRAVAHGSLRIERIDPTSSAGAFNIVIIHPISERRYSYWVNTAWKNLFTAASSLVTNETEGMDIIPPNPESIEISEVTSRFNGAIWFEKISNTRVTLAGVGGIGSYVGFLLARTHVGRITLWDDDRVEEGNMSGQLYSNAHIGGYKVDALASQMVSYANFKDVLAIRVRITSETEVEAVTICGFDNMQARKDCYQAWKNRLSANPELANEAIFIDGRLAAEEFQVLAIQGNDERAMKEYEDKWLFDSSEAEHTICSYKQTSFMANMIASVMVNLLVNFEANRCDLLVLRDVPFLTSYTAETMFFKVEL